MNVKHDFQVQMREVRLCYKEIAYIMSLHLQAFIKEIDLPGQKGMLELFHEIIKLVGFRHRQNQAFKYY